LSINIIKAGSNPEKGTKFVIRFPLYTKMKRENEIKKIQNTEWVWVADDEKVIRGGLPKLRLKDKKWNLIIFQQ